MRTTKFFTLAAVALLTTGMGFSSCSKENGDDHLSAGKFSVTLSFKGASTRADGGTAVGGTTVGIVDGYICFVSAGGAVTDVYTISSSPTSGKNINAATLGSTPVTIENVPGTSSRVFMIANKGSLSTPPTEGLNIAAFLSLNMKVTDQGDYTKVTSTGDAPLTPGATDRDRNAAINLSTQVARIQIGEIGFDSNITGTLAGIFVNGFYPAMQINGSADAWQTSAVAANYNESTGIFLSEYKNYVYDIVNKVIATAVRPNNGAWGYNLFAGATPQIVIKLTNVVVDGDVVLDDPQFVTINGFKKSDGTEIDQLEGGMIYSVKTGSVVIKYENITPEPGVTPLSVHVTVTPVTWQETVVEPNM